MTAPVVASMARTRFAVVCASTNPATGPPRDRPARARHEQPIARPVAGDDTDPRAVDVRDPRIGLRPGPAREPNARSGERPAHVCRPARARRARSRVPRRRSDRTATSSPRGTRRAVASSRPAGRPRRPRPTRRGADPARGARRARAARARRRRPRGSRRARRGRAGSAPLRAQRRRRDRNRGPQHPARGRSTGCRSANAAATTLHARSRASCSPGISIRSSSRFTARPPARRARGAGAS